MRCNFLFTKGVSAGTQSVEVHVMCGTANARCVVRSQTGKFNIYNSGISISPHKRCKFKVPDKRYQGRQPAALHSLCSGALKVLRGWGRGGSIMLFLNYFLLILLVYLVGQLSWSLS